MTLSARLLLLSLSSVAAIRVQEKHVISQEKTFKVQLLVTRHGLSCANVAQKWLGNFDFGRMRMEDPLLCASGEFASKEAAKEVNQWLESTGSGVDAVLSSVLARAMETAYHMFPKHSDTLHVMPYIRELVAPTDIGSSNQPKPQSEQPAHLGKPVALDYKWINEFGSKVGTWEEFLLFLEQFFLPELVSTKRLDATITLPVVTHSNFMRDSLKKCEKAWKDKGESKPLNNQVVNMVYTFELEAGNRSKEQTPSFFVLGSDYKDGRLNGAWVKLDALHSGRPQYAKQTDSNYKIQYSDSRKVWRMFKDNALGAGRQSLFQSEVDSSTVPFDGWGEPKEDGWTAKAKIAIGLTEKETVDYGTIPRFVLYNAHYKLKEATEIPCHEVASGLSLKNKQGKQSPKRLCDRDIGAQCAKLIKDTALFKSLNTAEDVLKVANSAYEEAQSSYSQNEAAFQNKTRALQEKSAAEDGHESLTVFGSSSKVQTAAKLEEQANLVEDLPGHMREMMTQQSVMKNQHAIISEVASETCMMGGHPVPPAKVSYW